MSTPLKSLASALRFCACNLLAASAAAQCTSPTTVPNQTDTSGTYSYTDPNALSASAVVISGSASMTLYAAKCIQLLPGFDARAGTAATTFHAWVDLLPAAVSVSPSSGSGLTQTFTWVASSPAGYSNLQDILALFNSSVSAASACYIHYSRASNLLYLADNTGANWSSGFVPGSSGSASNSQCTIYGNGSSFSASGTQLSISVPVSFQSTFGGPQNDYLVAYDNEGLNSNWQQVGTWTVPSSGQQYSLTTAVSPAGAGTILPASGSYASGTVVQVSASAASGYVFSGFGGNLGGTTNPQNLTMNGNESVTANFTQSATQYQLTTAASPSAGGSLSPPCAGGCMYSSGSNVTITATPNAGYVFSGYSGSVGSGANPLTVNMSSPISETATFAPAPLALPSDLKGINYFPRGHAWWSMLFDWYTQDCTTSTVPSSCVSGETVSQVVASDLQMLHQNGFNMIHLYIWDQDIVAATGSSAPSGTGFLGWDQGGGPQNSPANPLGPNDSAHNQWTALAAFASLCEANGISLFLEFATSHAANEVNADPSAAGTIGGDYAGWVDRFFDNVASSQNVLVWGLTYGTGQGVDSPFWETALPLTSAHFQAHPYSAGRALLAVQANFGLVAPAPYPPGQDGLGGTYQWSWQTAQQEAYEWQQFTTSPDLYIFQLWNASGADLQANLECVAGQSNSVCRSPLQQCMDNGMSCAAIPYSQMIVSEFGTGSSWEAYPIGNGIPAYGDAATPTTSAAGQAQWLTDTLCTMSLHGIRNTGYFGLYDSASFWEQQFSYTGFPLSWNGYWGLMSELSNYGAKPAWSAMMDFSSSACPTSGTPFVPILALQADAAYYTVNDSAKLTWSAAEATSLSLNEPPPESPPSSYECYKGALASSNSITGSCAYTSAITSVTGTITLTGANSDVDGSDRSLPSTQVATSVTVGPGPIVTGLIDHTSQASCNLSQNPGCVLSVARTDVIEIFGEGFNPAGGNMAEIASSGGQTWLSEADGLYFWDESRAQINAQLSCSAGLGASTLYVLSPNAGSAPSAGVSITVTAGSGCS